MTTVQPEYIDRKAVALRFSIPVATLATMATRGNGPPFVKVGTHRFARVLYKVSDVIAWLEAGRHVPAETVLAQQAKAIEPRAT